jgi:two-component system sensor histidine kinase CreC
MLIFAVCFFYPATWILDSLRTRYLEGVEDPLVDQANILAGIVGYQMENDQFDPETLNDALSTVYSRSLAAKIYELTKDRVDVHFYVTDVTGRVIFDSENKGNIGADYSHWQDVRLTLQGKYGARTSLKDPDDLTSSVLYVGAPVMVRGRIAGVLTVAKSTTNINEFLESAKPKIWRVGIISVFTAVLLSFSASVWIAWPIKRLTLYADHIRKGKRAEFPRLDTSEIGRMGQAFKKMQEALEGKRYVEQYIQTLTHEIKSPLSAIRGAAELLEEKMKPERRARFLANINNEANRIQDIVDRMLELSELETRETLQKKERTSLLSLVKAVSESKGPMLSKKGLSVRSSIPEDLSVRGDSFLLNQAIGNLIQNAIDFSPQNGQIDLIARVKDGLIFLTITDEGPGIPDYALEKVFDKFFSLQRPDSGEKSTGLGLNFVREVAELHGGQARLENRSENGARATLVIAI